jgi:hypothetical protein
MRALTCRDGLAVAARDVMRRHMMRFFFANIPVRGDSRELGGALIRLGVTSGCHPSCVKVSNASALSGPDS